MEDIGSIQLIRDKPVHILLVSGRNKATFFGPSSNNLRVAQKLHSLNLHRSLTGKLNMVKKVGYTYLGKA